MVTDIRCKPLTMRIPEKMHEEIQEIAMQERRARAAVVRDLLEIGIAERRKQNALRLLREGKATFAKAAEVARLSLWDFADLVKQEGIEWLSTYRKMLKET